MEYNFTTCTPITKQVVTKQQQNKQTFGIEKFYWIQFEELYMFGKF